MARQTSATADIRAHCLLPTCLRGFLVCNDASSNEVHLDIQVALGRPHKPSQMPRTLQISNPVSSPML